MRPILILGGGINGCALARELVLNGAPVVLVDRADLAAGATAYSSRLIHGGLRYLEYGEFGLVRESLAERTRLLQLAPQFVRPLELYIPTGNRFGGLAQSLGRFLGWRWWPVAEEKEQQRGSLLIRAGLTFYDWYANDPTLPRHRVRSVAAPDSPPVNRSKYRWLCSYYDAQIDFPERFVLALLEDARQLAEQQGTDFRVITYHEARLDGRVVEIAPTGNPNSVVEHFEPSAIVNATGAWVDLTLQRLAIPSRTLMGGTKGSHLFTFHEPLRQALAGRGIYAEARDGRPIFITPLAGTTLIGTTDVPFTGCPADAVASEPEIEYLLDAANTILPEIRLSRDHIDFHYSGVRPLPHVDRTTPAAITRRHWLEKHSQAPLPLYSVIGGKLTTCRSLAEQSVRTILGDLGQSVTANSRGRMIPGGEAVPDKEAALPGEVLDDTDLPLTLIRWIIRHQWVQTLDDLVERRLMLLYHQRLTMAALRTLAELLVAEHRLEAIQIEAAVQRTSERLRTHFGKRVL